LNNAGASGDVIENKGAVSGTLRQGSGFRSTPKLRRGRLAHAPITGYPEKVLKIKDSFTVESNRDGKYHHRGGREDLPSPTTIIKHAYNGISREHVENKGSLLG
jgi:hypothetical protein